jgi:hypothetical protein
MKVLRLLCIFLITDGKIQVPDTPDKLKDFKPPTDI